MTWGFEVDAHLAAEYRRLGYWRDETIVDDFFGNVSRYPDKVAIVGHRAQGDRLESLSYRRLARYVDRFAGAFLELGIGAGDIVSFQLPNWWEFVALHLACARIGAVTNPILPILRRREVGFILERTASRVCLVPATFRGFDHASMLGELQGEIVSLEHIFVLDGPATGGTESFEEFFLRPRWEDKHPPVGLDRLRPDADSLGQIQYTSGTTGEPKGVMHTYNTMYAGIRGVPEVLGLTGDDVVLMFSPMAHQLGFYFGCSMPVMYGMKLVLQDTWDPATMLRLVVDEGVTWTMGATPFVVDACVAAERRPRPSTLRLFCSAGAPIPPQLVHDARQTLGTKLIAIWGMTENGACTISRPGDSDERVASSDGAPVAWNELRVVDPEGRDCPPGESGRLLMRGANLCVGYFKRPDLLAATRSADGWFDTGDLARMDEAGHIRITGRGKDIIIRGGENIPVVEVEAILFQHPKVAEVAVVGYRDERLGERACAVVVAADPREAPTLIELTAHLEGCGMAKQFWPERLVLRGSLPKTASGKIQKFKLRHELANP